MKMKYYLIDRPWESSMRSMGPLKHENFIGYSYLPKHNNELITISEEERKKSKNPPIFTFSVTNRTCKLKMYNEIW